MKREHPARFVIRIEHIHEERLNARACVTKTSRENLRHRLSQPSQIFFNLWFCSAQRCSSRLSLDYPYSLSVYEKSIISGSSGEGELTNGDPERRSKIEVFLVLDNPAGGLKQLINMLSSLFFWSCHLGRTLMFDNIKLGQRDPILRNSHSKLS